MVCGSIWLILLFLRPVFAGAETSSGGGSTDGDSDDGGAGAVASVALTTTSGTTVTLAANGTSTQTSIEPAATSSAPFITFPVMSNATTCMPVTFTWQVTSSATNVTNMDVRLTVSNDDVQQTAPPIINASTPVTAVQPTGPDSPAQVINRPVTNQTALSSGSYNWSSVTVPTGWYILYVSLLSGYQNDVAVHSQQFFVMAGSNTSCVFPNISTSSVQSQSHLSPGALAGTVVGSVVGAAALLGAFAIPRLWRRGVPGHKAWQAKHGGLYQVF
ncbi:hypothetical protein JB92DRAFT_3114590 [Gautieria morchelliformis]|nr:hypothetical protein JB92DRAFT_3114590 [Gautieria morchelliformis]